MEISKKSWHYRIYPGSDYDVSLCKYFWGVVFAMTAITSGVCIAILVLFLAFVAPFWPAIDTIPSLVVWVIIGGFGIAYARDCVKGNRDAWWARVVWKYTPKPYNPNVEPPLLYTYLKAKKDKVCPLISFK